MKKRIKLISLVLSAVISICCLQACQSNIPDTSDTYYSKKTILTYSPDEEYFFYAPESPFFEELPTKDITGLKLTDPNSKFSFSANCEGDVSLYIWTSSVSDTDTETAVKISIDGLSEKSVNIISSGSETLIAQSLPRGNHTFTIEKMSGDSNLYIASVTLCGGLIIPTDICE